MSKLKALGACLGAAAVYMAAIPPSTGAGLVLGAGIAALYLLLVKP